MAYDVTNVYFEGLAEGNALVPHPVPWTLVYALAERFRGIPR